MSAELSATELVAVRRLGGARREAMPDALQTAAARSSPGPRRSGPQADYLQNKAELTRCKPTANCLRIQPTGARARAGVLSLARAAPSSDVAFDDEKDENDWMGQLRDREFFRRPTSRAAARTMRR